MFWRADTTITPSNHGPIPFGSARRPLHPSKTAVLWLVWPFIIWTMFVILINALGFIQLQAVTTPIAVANVGEG
jgi:hypothetical protein